MKNDLDCSCGGTFKHIDEEPGKDGTITDWYSCNGCQKWRSVTWDKDTQEILEIAEEARGSRPSWAEMDRDFKERIEKLVAERRMLARD